MVVVDIDCTLYSYAEWILCQKSHNSSLIQSLFDPAKLHANTDTVFIDYKTHMNDRINGLIQCFGKDHLCFYTAYPITNRKKEFLSQYKIPFHSSFPNPKTMQELTKLCNEKIDLVIGDRKIDKKLAKDLGAKWKGFRFYDYHHLFSGKTYTKHFLSLCENSEGG